MIGHNERVQVEVVPISDGGLYLRVEADGRQLLAMTIQDNMSLTHAVELLHDVLRAWLVRAMK